MKKIYSILLSAAFVASSSIASAQQLPNVGFESWKTACGSTEAFGTGGLTSSKTGEMRKRPGVEPTDWNGSSINQKVIMQKQETLIFDETTEKVSGSHSVKMQNKFVGVGTIGSVAPGFITLATPWVYAVSTIEDCDGGAYGGVAFTAKPDAITGKYKRTDATGENSHIIVYLWNGTFTSNVGSKSAPSQSRTNVDRAIWGTETSTGDGKLVAKCDYTFTTTDGAWKEITVPIEYVAGAGAPTMMNAVISGGDYWTRANMLDGTTLYADDVKFLYYSRLKDIKVGGVSVAGFNSDTYNYSMSGTTLPAESDIEVSHMGVGASHTIAIDKVNATVTITVTNAGNDVDNVASHTYVLQYEKNANVVKKEYPGYLNVSSDMLGGQLIKDQANTITIIENGDGTCTFILPDFRLDAESESMGDIAVENVTMTTGADGVTTYKGSVTDMSLAGDLLANVELNGTITAAGVVDMVIDVVWTNSGMGDIPILCTFTSTTSGVENIIAAPQGEVEYYNLQGVKVANPENGVFIRVQGGKATKVVK